LKTHVLSLLALLALGIASAVPAQAQTTVVNPRIVEFDPSADHSVAGADGQPLVQRYELRIFTLGNTQPYTTTDLGKPTPEADGKIRVDFTTRISPWPPDGNYEARVAAVGPSGLGVSDPSNAFALVSSPLPTCTYTLSSQNLSLGASPGTSSLTVTTGSTCAWTATSNATWVAPATGSGTGTASLSIIVAANTATTARTATLTIAGQAVTVTQAAAACTFSLSATGGTVPAAGGGGTVDVAAGAGCGWTASSSASWVTVTPSAGTAAGRVTFSAGPNTAGARTATLTIAGQSYVVIQAGLPCSTSIAPTAISASGYNQTLSITVTSGTGCSWTVSTPNSNWITLATTSGTANGSVSATVSRNSTKAVRTGTIVVGGQTCTITQATPPAPSQPKKPHVK